MKFVKHRLINFPTGKVYTDLLNPSEFVKQINILELYNNCLKSGDIVSLNFYLMLLKELKVSYAHDGSFIRGILYIWAVRSCLCVMSNYHPFWGFRFYVVL